MSAGHRAGHYPFGKIPSFVVRRFFPAEPIFNFDSLERAMSVLLFRMQLVAESERYCLRGSPVGRNETPEMPSSEASTFLSHSRFAPLRHSAATSIRIAVAGVVSGCNLN